MIEGGIEKGIPVNRAKKGRDFLYPELFKMKIGESISVPIRQKEKLRCAAMYCQRISGKKFVTGICPINPDKYRAWRVAK